MAQKCLQNSWRFNFNPFNGVEINTAPLKNTGPTVRAIAVFLITYIADLTLFFYSFHAFLARAGLFVFALYLVIIGYFFGSVAACWQWSRKHISVYQAASFASALTILLPVVFFSYGYAWKYLPFLLLWMAMNHVGYLATSYMLQRIKRGPRK